MDYKNEQKVTLEPTELLLAKAEELVGDVEAANYEHAIKLGGALGGVYTREHKRLAEKYGEDHPRTQQAKLRLDLGGDARKALVQRRAEVKTPSTDPETGWTVDGIVTAIDGKPAENVTVAVYDRAARRLDGFPASVTDEKGFFSIAVRELPEKELRVWVWASIGEKILKSNENQLAPKAGGNDRIKIALEDRGPDVYKTTPNAKIDLSQTKSEPERTPDDPKSAA